jgi:hypothetical protein
MNSDLRKRTELAQCFHRRDGKGHFRLVVGIFVYGWALTVNLLRQLFIRVRLDREGFANGEDLKQVRELARGSETRIFGRVILNHLGIGFDNIDERLQDRIFVNEGCDRY